MVSSFFEFSTVIPTVLFNEEAVSEIMNSFVIVFKRERALISTNKVKSINSSPTLIPLSDKA